MVRCRSCHREVDADAALCVHCGSFLDSFSIGPDPSVAQPAPPGEQTPHQPPAPGEEPPSVPVPCDQPLCSFEVYPGEATCLMGHPAAPRPTGEQNPAPPGEGATLVLPGGARVSLAAGVPVQIGRHSSEPTVKAALARLDAVSRRHAVVVLEGGLLRVTHVGTTNPTYVNDESVAGSVLVPLPAEVRLGQEVRLNVTRETNDGH